MGGGSASYHLLTYLAFCRMDVQRLVPSISGGSIVLALAYLPMCDLQSGKARLQNHKPERWQSTINKAQYICNAGPGLEKENGNPRDMNEKRTKSHPTCCMQDIWQAYQGERNRYLPPIWHT